MRLVAAETLRNRRRGYKFTVKQKISGCRNRLLNEFDMTNHSCTSKTALKQGLYNTILLTFRIPQWSVLEYPACKIVICVYSLSSFASKTCSICSHQGCQHVRCGEQKNHFTLSGIEIRFLHLSAQTMTQGLPYWSGSDPNAKFTQKYLKFNPQYRW